MIFLSFYAPRRFCFLITSHLHLQLMRFPWGGMSKVKVSHWWNCFNETFVFIAFPMTKSSWRLQVTSMSSDEHDDDDEEGLALHLHLHLSLYCDYAEKRQWAEMRWKRKRRDKNRHKIIWEIGTLSFLFIFVSCSIFSIYYHFSRPITRW